MRDRVEYELPFGLLGRLAHRLAVRAELGRIFAHRVKVVEEVFGARADTPRVAVAAAR